MANDPLAANNFSGVWNTTWTGGTNQQSVNMTILPNGMGTYIYESGTVVGTFGPGNLSYSGTWTQQKSSPYPPVSGQFTLVLTSPNSFVGGWAVGDAPGGQWNGTRVS